MSYSLLDALLRKYGRMFWKYWRSKFDSSIRCMPMQVDGGDDENGIASNVMYYFAEICSRIVSTRADNLNSDMHS
jgi:hypothetical protein